MNEGGEVKDCNNYGKIQGQERVGGIVGRTNGSIKNCMSNASIKGEYNVGGIAGTNMVETSVSDCCNKGMVSSTGKLEDSNRAPTGGIVGNNEGTVQRCINQKEVTAKYKAVGGIVGENYGNVMYCCNSGKISGENSQVGGIVGRNNKEIGYVYNIAETIEAGAEDTAGTSNVGGISGNSVKGSSSSIQYAYNTAKIIGNQRVGGIIGSLNTGATVSNTYNIGVLDTTQTTNVGNIAGYTYSTSAITNSPQTTESQMISWSQTTINTNLPNFVKKTNGLPILNITVRGITF